MSLIGYEFISTYCDNNSNLTFYLKKNLDRGFKDVSLFEIGPIFKNNKPGEQFTVIGALKSGKISRLNWNEENRSVDVFDAKKDTIQTLLTPDTAQKIQKASESITNPIEEMSG